MSSSRSKRTTAARIVLGAVLATSLSACSWLFPPSPAIEVGAFPALSADATSELMERIADDRARLHTARILFKSTLRRSIGSETVRDVVVFEHPERLRLEVFAPGLNKLLALLITQGNSLYMLDPIERRVFLGDATAPTIERLLSFPLTPPEFMRWAVGRFPGELGTGTKFAGQDGTGKVLLVHRPDERRELRALLEERGDEVILVRLEVVEPASGALLFRSDFRYEPPPTGPPDPASSVPTIATVPAAATIELPKRDAEGELVFERLTVNPVLGKSVDRLFNASVPADVEVVDLNRLPPESR